MIQKNSFVTLILIVISFSYGYISTRYDLFPIQQLAFIKKSIANKLSDKDTTQQDATLIEYPYWKDRTTFFDSVHSTAKIVMLGDSITDGAEWHELFPGVSILNRGISHDTAYGLLKRLDNIIKINPEYVFIMIGVNDITHDRPTEKILNDYIDILKILQSNNITPIMQSTLYVATGYPKSEKVNIGVKKLNSALAEYANKNNIVFVNLNDGLSKNETLRSDLTYDYIHINGNGYQIWKAAISKYIKQ